MDENKEPLIYKQICSAIGKISAVKKSLENKDEGFKYRGVDDVMNEIHGVFARQKIFVVPEVLSEKRSVGKSQDGSGVFFSRQKIRFTFYAEDGSSVSCVVIGEAMDCSDKASNKALASGLKYALLQVFCIPTEDDNDPDKRSVKTKAGSMKADPPKESGGGKPAPLAGGESTEEEKKTIHELLSSTNDKKEPLFTKKEKADILKTRESLTAGELIEWLKGEIEKRRGGAESIPEEVF